MTGLRIGSRVQLVRWAQESGALGLGPGAAGTVDFIDSLGTLFVRWDAGPYLALIAGASYWAPVEPEGAS